MEEELAEAAGHGQFSTQFEKLHVEDPQIEDIKSDPTPQVESSAAQNEPTCSTTPPPRDTPSPEAQPSARNSGIMQSRWANAPDEPVVVVVEPHSEVSGSKDASSLEQGGHGTPSRNRRARGTNHSKKDSTQSVRSGRSSHTGSPKKSNREGSSKQAKARSTSSHAEKGHITTPLVAAHTSPKTNDISPSKLTSNAANNNNNNQSATAATAVAPVVDKKTDGPIQTPESSPSKNEISLSRWA